MKTNESLQKDVQNALKWEPILESAEIGVTVKDGLVTLTGIVDSYVKKTEAETIIKNLTGVKALIEKIEVRYASAPIKVDDNALAKEILNAFQWNWEIPAEKVKVKVENGWVTLEGELPWYYQKTAAKDAVIRINYVTGVTNNIIIKSDTTNNIERQDIVNAISRNWSLSEEDIDVKVLENKVTLSGTVDSWYKKDTAARIAWKAKNVWMVENEIEVKYIYEYDFDGE